MGGIDRRRANDKRRAPTGSCRTCILRDEKQYQSLVRLAALLTGDAEHAETVAADALVALPCATARLHSSELCLAYLQRQVVERSRGRPGRPAGERHSGAEQSGRDAPGRGEAQPGRRGTQPGRGEAQPGRGEGSGRRGTQPGRSEAQPGRGGTQPGRGGAQPGRSEAQPGRGAAAPTEFARLPVIAALGELPPHVREAVVLTYYLDLPAAEAAAIAGVSEAALRANLAAAMRVLDDKLGGI